MFTSHHRIVTLAASLVCVLLTLIFIAVPVLSNAATSQETQVFAGSQNSSEQDLLLLNRSTRQVIGKQGLVMKTFGSDGRVSQGLQSGKYLFFIKTLALPAHGIDIFLHRYSLF